jgi:hypothetical protein
MMRTPLKIALLGLYIATLLTARSFAEQLGPVSSFVVMTVLGYCGIIVVAHLIAAVVSLCRWLTLVIGREPQPDEFTEAAELDVETEAI